MLYTYLINDFVHKNCLNNTRVYFSGPLTDSRARHFRNYFLTIACMEISAARKVYIFVLITLTRSHAGTLATIVLFFPL